MTKIFSKIVIFLKVHLSYFEKLVGDSIKRKGDQALEVSSVGQALATQSWGSQSRQWGGQVVLLSGRLSTGILRASRLD